MAGGISGGGLAMTAAGIILTWSGVTGRSVTTVVKDVLAGKDPRTAAQSSLSYNPYPASTQAGVTQTNPFTGNTGPVSSSAAKNMSIGRALAAAYGWSGSQWSDLVALWNRESGWNNNAQNPTSTAYGIAQFLDTTWTGYGTKTANPYLQIKYGLEYIRNRYGSPAAAWAHETQYGWY